MAVTKIRYINQIGVVRSVVDGSIIISELLNGVEVSTGNPQTQYNEIPSGSFTPLPDSGFLKKGSLYTYQGSNVLVTQDHYRTLFPPIQTPALFSFYRAVSEGQAWIENEIVPLNGTRTYLGQTYKCIQSHLSIVSWNPVLTSGVLWIMVTEIVLPWRQPTGGHDAYNIGDKCTFNGFTWESIINANVWSPSVYPAGWRKL